MDAREANKKSLDVLRNQAGLRKFLDITTDKIEAACEQGQFVAIVDFQQEARGVPSPAQRDALYALLIADGFDVSVTSPANGSVWTLRWVEPRETFAD